MFSLYIQIFCKGLKEFKRLKKVFFLYVLFVYNITHLKVCASPPPLIFFMESCKKGLSFVNNNSSSSSE